MNNWPSLKQRRASIRERAWSNRPRHLLDRTATRLMKKLEAAGTQFPNRLAAARVIMTWIVDLLAVGMVVGLWLFVVLALMWAR